MPDSNTSVPSSPLSFPLKHTVNLELEFECVDQDALSYLVQPDGSLNLGFIADLFDLCNFQADLGVCAINKVTPQDIRKIFSRAL